MASFRLDRKLLFDHYVGGTLAWCLNAMARLLALVWRRDHSLRVAPRAVLFIKFLGLGSVVRSSFLLTAVRKKYPDTRIYFATFPGVAPVVRMYSDLDKVLVVRDDSLSHLIIDTLKLIVWCWRNPIDLVIDLEFHSKYSSVVSALSLGRDRAGFAGITSRFRRGLYTHLVFWNPVRYVGKAYEQLRRALTLPEAKDPPLVISREAEAEAQAFLEGLGCSRESRIIGINPNASDLRPERRWPPQYFSKLLENIPVGHDFVVLICGAQSEWDIAEEVLRGCASTPYPVHNIAGKLSFPAFCALMTRFDVFVTNDSGPMHVARSLRIPTVSLWGPTHPVNYSPPGGNHIGLYRPIYCSPCTHATDVPPCGGDNQCLKRIEPATVLKAMCKLLKIASPQLELKMFDSARSNSVLGYWHRESVGLSSSDE
ncbi:MAG: hypothetical protein RL518_2802 [Pseudomonadota bacterium]